MPLWDKHVIPLERSPQDHMEVGAPPLKTKFGWLLLYSHIENYFSPPPIFGVEAAILNMKNPRELLSRTKQPLMVPRDEYEKYGRVPNIVFPSGAIVKENALSLYYGALILPVRSLQLISMDCCVETLGTETNVVKLERFVGNPILSPILNTHGNPNLPLIRSNYEGGKVHLVYRAMSQDNTSVLATLPALTALILPRDCPSQYIHLAKTLRKSWFRAVIPVAKTPGLPGLVKIFTCVIPPLTAETSRGWRLRLLS